MKPEDIKKIADLEQAIDEENYDEIESKHGEPWEIIEFLIDRIHELDDKLKEKK